MIPKEKKQNQTASITPHIEPHVAMHVSLFNVSPCCYILPFCASNQPSPAPLTRWPLLSGVKVSRRQPDNQWPLLFMTSLGTFSKCIFHYSSAACLPSIHRQWPLATYSIQSFRDKLWNLPHPNAGHHSPSPVTAVINKPLALRGCGCLSNSSSLYAPLLIGFSSVDPTFSLSLGDALPPVWPFSLLASSPRDPSKTKLLLGLVIVPVPAPVNSHGF